MAVGFRDLQRDVAVLGGLVGQVIREQAGLDVFDWVEHLRRTALDRPASLPDVVATIPSEAIDSVLRGFLLYFRVVNHAEIRHRKRVLADRVRRGDLPPDGLLGAMRRWQKEADAEPIGQVSIHPVLTAHPTEIRRRTIQRHLYELGALLDVDRPLPEALAEPGSTLEADILQCLTLLWQTHTVRARRPTPADEIRAGLAYFDRSLLQVVPELLTDIERLDAGMPPIRIRFGSWIGSDRDGNPFVTAAVTASALDEARQIVQRYFQREVERLGYALSLSRRYGQVLSTLEAALERAAAEFPDLARDLAERKADEPFAQHCAYMSRRIQAIGEPHGYRAPADLAADLDLLDQALRARNAGRTADGLVRPLRLAVDVFGFQLVDQELRQHRDILLATVSAVAAADGQPVDVGAMSEPERQRWLLAGLEAPAPTGKPVIASDQPGPVADLVETLARLPAWWQRYGPMTLRVFVISGASGPSDLLAVLWLAHRFHLADPRPGGSTALPLRPVPLFEDEASLRGAGKILRELLALPHYRRFLAESAADGMSGVQEVMLGYSDSNKSLGYVAANYLVWHAQRELMRVGAEAGIQIRFFHGRGGSIGRGGGAMRREIEGTPGEALREGFKWTEQGEVLNARYGDPVIARRHLEQVVTAVIDSIRRQDAELPEAELIAEWADRSAMHYRALIDDPDFFHYFSQATPIDVIRELRIGSRPATRASFTFERLRAIPWVFAWTQCRVNLPGWYGFGVGLSDLVREHPDAIERLRAAHATSPFLRSVVEGAELALATSWMTIGNRYAELVEDAAVRQRFWSAIAAEYRRSRTAVAQITGHATPLATRPWLRRSVRLRNPYVGVIHGLQIRLLRSWRAHPEDERLLALLQVTVNAIAAGVQTTG